MDVWQAVVLGLIQGGTEFIPVSSSAHLVIVPWLLGWPEPGLAFDTVVHWGTLLSVVAFFRKELLPLIIAWGRSLVRRRVEEPEAKLAWLIVVGTIPAAVMGYYGEDFFSQLFGKPTQVGGLLLVTGLLLALSERWGRGRRDLGQLRVVDSLLIGLAQGAAIAPGISRSGATIATGLFLGLKKTTAARYSFLLALPIILGAGLSQLLKLPQTALGTQLPLLVVGFGAAALSGYGCIWLLLAHLQRGRLYIYAAYCWAVGLGVLAISRLIS